MIYGGKEGVGVATEFLSEAVEGHSSVGGCNSSVGALGISTYTRNSTFVFSLIFQSNRYLICN